MCISSLIVDVTLRVGPRPRLLLCPRIICSARLTRGTHPRHAHRRQSIDLTECWQIAEHDLSRDSKVSSFDNPLKTLFESTEVKGVVFLSLSRVKYRYCEWWRREEREWRSGEGRLVICYRLKRCNAISVDSNIKINSIHHSRTVDAQRRHLMVEVQLFHDGRLCNYNSII